MMNPPYKNPLELKNGRPPLTSQPGHGYLNQFKPGVIPSKNAVSPSKMRQPAVPAASRPNSNPKVVQAKMAGGGQSPAGQSPRQPAAPPAYHPQPVLKCLQLKAAMKQPSPAGQTKTTPVAPPVYRPQPLPKILQAKTAAGITAPARGTASGKLPIAGLLNKPNGAPQVSRPDSIKGTAKSLLSPSPQRHTLQPCLKRNVLQRSVDVASASSAVSVPLIPSKGGGGGGGGGGKEPDKPPAKKEVVAVKKPAPIVWDYEFTNHWNNGVHIDEKDDVEADAATFAGHFRALVGDATPDDTRLLINYRKHYGYVVVVAFYRRNGNQRMIRFHTAFFSPGAQVPDGGGLYGTRDW